MSKSTKIIAAFGIVAGLGVAALPLGVDAADTHSATDTLNISVDEQCTISQHTHANGTEPSTWSGDTLSYHMANGNAETNLGTTTFHVICNNQAGAKLSIKEAKPLTGSVSDNVNIPFAAAQPKPENSTYGIAKGTAWQGPTAVIGTWDSPTAGEDVTVTYGVSIDATQGQGTYTGTVEYELAPNANANA